MALTFRRRTSALMSVPVLAMSLALGACGSKTVDPKSGEDLIKKNLPPLLQGVATVKSVSCPSGVKPTDGTTFNCKVDLLQTSNKREHKGTITLHITGGGKKAVFTLSDIHVK